MLFIAGFIYRGCQRNLRHETEKVVKGGGIGHAYFYFTTTSFSFKKNAFFSPQISNKILNSQKIYIISYHPRRNFFQPHFIKNLLRLWSRFCKIFYKNNSISFCLLILLTLLMLLTLLTLLTRNLLLNISRLLQNYIPSIALGYWSTDVLVCYQFYLQKIIVCL